MKNAQIFSKEIVIRSSKNGMGKKIIFTKSYTVQSGLIYPKSLVHDQKSSEGELSDIWAINSKTQHMLE